MENIKFKKVGLYSQGKKVFEDLARVFQQCFPSQKQAEIGYLVKMIKKEMKEGHRYIVGEVAGRPVGFTSWRVWGEPRHELAELYHIAVLPRFTSRGLGKLLVNELIKRASCYYQKYGFSGLRKLFVLTHAGNARARKFYESLGFKEAAMIPEFFRKGVDEIMLARDFPEVRGGKK